MSSVRGTISVDVAFTDSTTVGGAQSLKTITLRDATEYTTGKVKYHVGTVSTTLVTITDLPYRDASGELVGALTSSRIAFQASPAARIRNDQGDVLMESKGNLSVDSFRDHLVISTTAGTASYTLVLYGT